jgi:hypothetical protein
MTLLDTLKQPKIIAVIVVAVTIVIGLILFLVLSNQGPKSSGGKSGGDDGSESGGGESGGDDGSGSGGGESGSDIDSHGCKPSAGYVWCPAMNECVRPWEDTNGVCGFDPTMTTKVDGNQ